jgi:sugar porter (SP) family MFS transporter
MVKTIDNKLFFGVKGGWLVFWITVACGTDMLMFGYDQAVFSGVIVSPDFLDRMNLRGNTTMISTVSAIYAIGCFVGSLIAFTIGERLGRKTSIYIGTTVMSVGVILMTAAYGMPQLFAGRVILGVGNGINTATAPIWQTETSPAKWRGKLVMLEMWLNIAGFTLVNWINFGVSYVGGGFQWRFPLALQFIFIFIIYATVWWLPESPRWLVQHERQEEAHLVLSCLENKDIEDPIVLAQLKEIQFTVQYERDHSIRWRDLLRASQTEGTKPLRRLILGAGTQFIQQFEGINIMSYYLPSVLIEEVGLTEHTAQLVTGINAITYLVFSSAAIPLVERWGRRSLFLISTAGQGLAFLVITILLKYASDGSKGSALASIPFFFIYYIAFGLGALGIPWLYPTEINSIAMRTKGAATATATNWITNYAIVQMTPPGIKNLGWKFWIVFTVFNAAFMPVLYFFYPETGKSRRL